MSTTQRVLGFVAGLVAVFALGLGLGQLIDLDDTAPSDQHEMEMPDDDQ